MSARRDFAVTALGVFDNMGFKENGHASQSLREFDSDSDAIYDCDFCFLWKSCRWFTS